jgi:hypothetical protein
MTSSSALRQASGGGSKDSCVSGLSTPDPEAQGDLFQAQKKIRSIFRLQLGRQAQGTLSIYKEKLPDLSIGGQKSGKLVLQHPAGEYG